MNNSDDKELQNYLNGSDKLSATYQSLQDEKPSAALDESILQAARESVADKAASNKVIPKQAYSIAASICVAVLAASLFLNNDNQLARNEIEELSIPVSDMPAVEVLSADDAELGLQNTASGVTADADEMNPGASRVIAPTPQFELDNIEAAGAETFSAAAEASIQEAEELISIERRLELAEEAELTEVQVQRETFVGFDYRLNINTWLAEIQRLMQAGNELELAEERRLFSESYPDIDIDQALVNLPE